MNYCSYDCYIDQQCKIVKETKCVDVVNQKYFLSLVNVS